MRMATKRFSPTRHFDKKKIESIPQGKPVVYKIKGSRGNNIYTGSAKRGRVQARLKEHLPGGPDSIKGAAGFHIKRMRSIEEAQQEEKKIIKKEKPKYNKQS